MVQGRHCSALGSVTFSRELIRVFFLFGGGGGLLFCQLQSKRLFSLGQKSHQQQEQELPPHATAVSEAIHQESLPAVPSSISTVQQQSWAPDLDASGEGEISVPSSKLWVGGGLQCPARHIFWVIV